MKIPFPQHHLAFPYTPMAAIHIYLKKMKRKTCTHVVIGNHPPHPNKMMKKSLTPCQLVQIDICFVCSFWNYVCRCNNLIIEQFTRSTQEQYHNPKFLEDLLFKAKFI